MTQVKARGKRAEILKLAKKGHDIAEIAAELGMSAGTVRSSISALRIRGHEIPYRRNRMKGVATLSLTISQELAKGINGEALARRITPRDLAIMILTIAIRDKMVTAILDDAPKAKERKS